MSTSSDNNYLSLRSSGPARSLSQCGKNTNKRRRPLSYRSEKAIGEFPQNRSKVSIRCRAQYRIQPIYDETESSHPDVESWFAQDSRLTNLCPPVCETVSNDRRRKPGQARKDPIEAEDFTQAHQSENYCQAKVFSCKERKSEATELPGKSDSPERPIRTRDAPERKTSPAGG
jgi:hypothetical protein